MKTQLRERNVSSVVQIKWLFTFGGARVWTAIHAPTCEILLPSTYFIADGALSDLQSTLAPTSSLTGTRSYYFRVTRCHIPTCR